LKELLQRSEALPLTHTHTRPTGAASALRGPPDARRRADGGRGVGQGAARLGADRDYAAQRAVTHAGVMTMCDVTQSVTLADRPRLYQL